MKKEEIYVVIDSEPKRLRAIQILSDAGENIDYSNFELSEILRVHSVDKDWFLTTTDFCKTLQEITLDQLELLLNNKYISFWETPVEPIKLDALKLIAESYGFELVEKVREIKAGDFGKFSSKKGGSISFGFLYRIISGDVGVIYSENGKDITTHWSNFAHLTDEEKKQIQENW